MFQTLILRLIHFSCTILILKCLYFVLPSYLTSCFFGAANFILCFIIAKCTFGYSKKLFFSEKVKPEGKAVLITGCARGFGKHIAKHLDSKGFHVFASCRNPNSPGADDLRKSCSSRLQVIELDVTNDESVEKAAEFVKDNLGGSELWAVINNAGIQKGFLLELTKVQDFKDTMEVNGFGQVRVTKAFLPLLRKSRGRVINISSLGGRIALPMCGSYSMSKFAAVGFTESLRVELDMWGIRVISVEPEFFETDLTIGENATMRAVDAFRSADKNIREDYGEEFIKKFTVAVGKAYPPSPKMHKVLEDIESAVTLKNPDAVYTTCRNALVKFIFDCYAAYPVECQVFIAKKYYRIFGMPNPEKANKMD